jgi:CheY-like chemotaxis protein
MAERYDATPVILVVDDDRDIRESVVEVLEDEGYVVASAADGVQALSYLRQRERVPDLILLDIMMPNMNGFEFREAQLQDQRHAAIPVAVLTADGNAKAKAERLNVAGYARKPLRASTLLELVDAILGRSSTPSPAL